MTSTSKPPARTSLHDWHVEHGAHIVERNGWQLAMHFGNIESETDAVRHGIGLADMSAFAKLRLDGPGVPGVASGLTCEGSIEKPGDVATFDCNGPAFACRLTERSVLLLASAPTGAALAGQFPSRLNVVATDITMALAGFVLVGPHVGSLLRRFTTLDVSTAKLPPGHCAETNLAGVHALLVWPPRSSHAETRLYIAADVAEYLWEKLLHVGREFRIVPLGIPGLANIGIQTSF